MTDGLTHVCNSCEHFFVLKWEIIMLKHEKQSQELLKKIAWDTYNLYKFKNTRIHVLILFSQCFTI